MAVCKSVPGWIGGQPDVKWIKMAVAVIPMGWPSAVSLFECRQQHRHHPLEQSRITKVHVKSLVENADLGGAINELRPQTPVQIVTTFETREHNCLQRVDHLAGSYRQSGTT